MKTPRPHGLFWWGLGLLVGAVMWAIVVLVEPLSGPVRAMDSAWNDLVLSAQNAPATVVALVLNYSGGPTTLVIAVGLIIWWLATKRRWAALFLVTVYVATGVITQVVKLTVLRERPPDPMVVVDTGSFPSGHVVGTVALGLVVVAVMARKRPGIGVAIVVVVTALMMWDRAYLQAHWLSDTVAGALIGASVTVLLWWVFHPLLERDVARRSPTAQSDLT